MTYETLNSLLKEYEQKKLKAEQEAEKRKEDLYEKYPKLKEIETELNNFAINTAKNILKNGNASTEQKELENKVSSLKQEKENIFKQLNIPSNYLKPHYSCTFCNDTGYITDSNYKTSMCSCLKQSLLDDSFNKSNISNLNKENFSTFNPNIFSDEVDVAKYRFNISPRKNITNIKEKCIKFVNDFDNPNCKNLLFTGNTGLRQNIYVELYRL